MYFCKCCTTAIFLSCISGGENVHICAVGLPFARSGGLAVHSLFRCSAHGQQSFYNTLQTPPAGLCTCFNQPYEFHILRVSRFIAAQLELLVWQHVKSPLPVRKNPQISPRNFHEEKGYVWGNQKIQLLWYLKTSHTIVTWLFSVLSCTGMQCAQLFSWVPCDNTSQD